MQRIVELNKEIDEVKKEEIPTRLLPLKKQLDEKHPKAIITHELPIMKAKGNVEEVEIRVQNFVTDFWELRNRVGNLGFTMKAYREKYPDLPYEERAMLLAFDIFKHTRRYVTYKYDSNQFGLKEFWLLPEVTYYLGEGDCEDSSNLLLSWFKAAGIPSFMVRNTCGETKLGGHSTVYVYDFKAGLWRHMEATETSIRAKQFEQLPTKNNPDQLWITDVWFSFNWDDAWHKFETEHAQATMPEKFIVNN
jgi:hypothetical protein